MVSLISPPSSPSFPSIRFRETSFFSTRLLPQRGIQQRSNSENYRWYTVKCRLLSANVSPSSSPSTVIKEPHKYFDQVIITVRSGDGGHGAILSMPNQRVNSSKGKQEKEKTRKKSSFRRDFDGSLILPTGGHGGDVVIYADEGKDSLLEFHKKSRYNAKRGGNVDAMGVLTSQLRDGLASPTLRIPVPQEVIRYITRAFKFGTFDEQYLLSLIEFTDMTGTVVKHKRGKLLADLAQPGDEILVARGGQGGISLLETPQHNRKKMMALTTNVMRDETDKVLVLGQPGEEVSLELILRVVADVGLVGLPNAGKSTLLAAITLAKPDIADYPFTTLMPNLGRLGGDPNLGAEMYSSEATLADLPGLIEGAHLGKGLGRNFLRHLRRTRLLVHVVDAATENPLNDYRTVREKVICDQLFLSFSWSYLAHAMVSMGILFLQELRMYNPEYLERPYIVVLNKIDLPEAKARLPSLTEEIQRIGSVGTHSEPKLSSEAPVQSLSNEGDIKERKLEDYPPPLSVVGVSVLKGNKIDDMLKEIRAGLRKCMDSKEASSL
ncbi:putative GTP-binding protein OBGC2 [Senna tora]|uniref:Putative GTP-binding protein OBGC2 n=1 Tax=Senna tora TaxID=362788 RepID=A0A834TWX6_9FABA|nr:putative GTP-binding protein OBGC2 [Senna tora]